MQNTRLAAHEIYGRVVDDARMEINRPIGALAFSGFASGLFMGLTGLGVAGAAALLPNSHFVPLLFYPLGFMVVVIGRAQLFTENTLFPVILIMEERRYVWVTLRLWVVVLVANVFGALAFAALVIKLPSLPPDAVDQLVKLGTTAAHQSDLRIFSSAIVGGWLIALMSWVVSSANQTIGQIAVLWLVVLPVGLLHLAHCIASSGYILAAVLHGDVSGGEYASWLGLAVAGNIVGGVGIVSILNYGQVRAGTKRKEIAEEARAANP